MIIGIVSQKGGVGKTTLALALAAALARRRRVLLIDADAQATAGDWGKLRADRPAPFAIVGMARPNMARDALAMAANFAATVIDAPPHDGAIARGIIIAADIVLIPVEPSGFSTWAADRTVALVREAALLKSSLRAGLVISRKIANTVLGREAHEMAAGLGLAVANAEIFQRVQYAEAGTLGLTIFEHAPRSAAAREIDALTAELRKLPHVKNL